MIYRLCTMVAPGVRSGSLVMKISDIWTTIWNVVTEMKYASCLSQTRCTSTVWNHFPDSKVHGANMGSIWVRKDPGEPHVGPMNFAIWVIAFPPLLTHSARVRINIMLCCHCTAEGVSSRNCPTHNGVYALTTMCVHLHWLHSMAALSPFVPVSWSSCTGTLS